MHFLKYICIFLNAYICCICSLKNRAYAVKNMHAYCHNPNNNYGHNHTRRAIFLIGNLKFINISEGKLLVIAED